MVLQDVADRADALVERAATLHVERLRHRHLHAADVVAVPHRLEERVREAEHEEILDRFLAEVVVDAEDVVLGEHLVEGLVEVDRRLQVASERLLHHDAAALVEPDRRELGGDRGEHVGRDRHVEHGHDRVVAVERGAQFVPGVRVGVVALHEVHVAAQRIDDSRVRVVDVFLDRLTGVSAEVLVGPVAASDTDDRDAQFPRLLEAVQGGEELAHGEVAGGPEQDERVGVGLVGLHASGVDMHLGVAHRVASLRSMWPPKPARIADST